MSDNLILGAMVSPDGKAPFVRAPLVTWAREGGETMRDIMDVEIREVQVRMRWISPRPRSVERT